MDFRENRRRYERGDSRTVIQWAARLLHCGRLACHTQAEIAERVGLTREAVTMFLQKMSKEYQENQIDIFRNFDPQIYTVWNFAK